MLQNYNIAKIESLNVNEHLYYSLLNQLEKDFAMCGIEWEEYPNVLPENLFQEISEMVTKLLNGKINADIRAWLYRIDVREKALRQIEILSVSEITTLVIEREMEKVWLRQKYSNL